MAIRIHSTSLNLQVPRAASAQVNAAQTLRSNEAGQPAKIQATFTDPSVMTVPAGPLPPADDLNLRIRIALNAYIDLANDALSPINPRIDEFV